MQASRQISYKAGGWRWLEENRDCGVSAQLCVSIFIIFIKNVIMQHVRVYVQLARGEAGFYVK